MQDKIRRKVLITGASRGVGRCIALQLAKHGPMELHLVGRDRMDLQKVEQEVMALNPQTTVCLYAIDLCDEAQLKTFLNQLTSIDILINNAGVGVFGHFGKSNFDSLSRMMKLNMEVPLRLIHHFLPSLLKVEGSIVNVASLAGIFPLPYFAAYSASKAFLIHFGEALQFELKDKNLRLLTICPAGIKTNFHKEAGLSEEIVKKFDSTMMTPEQIADFIVTSLEGKSATLIPGRTNQIFLKISHWIPRRILIRVFGSVYRQYDKN